MYEFWQTCNRAGKAWTPDFAPYGSWNIQMLYINYEARASPVLQMMDVEFFQKIVTFGLCAHFLRGDNHPCVSAL